MHTLENPLITLHDARGRGVFAEPLLHHDPSQVLFTKAWDWVRDEQEKEKIRGAYQEVLFDRKEVVLRIDICMKDGSVIPYECRATPVETNEVVMIVSSVAITDNSKGNLTERESECLRHLVTGENTKRIAREMGVKVTTVNTYKQRLKEKLGVDSLAGLIAYGCRHMV